MGSALTVNSLLDRYSLPKFLFASLLISLTLLSHLEWAITAGVTCILIALFRKPDVLSVGRVVGLGALGFFFAAPWWAQVASSHGLAPFIAASKTSEWSTLSVGHFLSPPVAMPILIQVLTIALAAIGAYAAVRKKQWLPVLWFVFIHVTTPRHGPTAASMPLAILIATGIAQGLVPWIENAIGMGLLTVGAHAPRSTQKAALHNRAMGGISLSLAAVFLALTSYGLIHAGNFHPAKSTLSSLNALERDAMDWLRVHAPQASEFVVMSGSTSWQDDRVAEWFPFLAERRSLTTAQGLEWIHGDLFHEKVREVIELKDKQRHDVTALVQFVEKAFQCHTHVAVFLPNDGSDFGAFVRSGKYNVVYGNRSALILERDAQFTCAVAPSPDGNGSAIFKGRG